MRTAILILFLASPAAAGPCEALAAIARDARSLPYEIACETRYFYDRDDIKLRRQLKYWANHLSREVEFATPRPVGGDAVAVRLSDFRWDARVWDKQLNTEPFFYYLLREYHDGKWCQTPLGAELIKLTHTPVPVVYADWFLFYTSRQINLDNKETGAGYYDFLGIKDQKAFEDLRFTDRKIAIKIGDELAAVLEEGRSRVSQKDRRIEWYSTYGDGEQGLWLTKDADDTSKGNTATGTLADGEFKFAAQEAFVGLPNRLWGVGAFDAKGVRQATVPDKIAADASPHHRGNDRRIHPFSCFHCHTSGGLQAVDDWARNRGLRSPNQLDAFRLADFLRLKRQFFRDLDGQLAKGRKRYGEAVKELVSMIPETAVKEHADTYYAYLRPRTVADVAGYLEVTPEQLVKELQRFFDPRNNSPQALVDKKRLAGFLPLARMPPEPVPIAYVEQFAGDLNCILRGHK